MFACRRCIPSTSLRSFTTSALRPAAAVAAEASKDVKKTSTTPSPGPALQISGTPVGTKLLGINYFKNKPIPVAMEDNEYPAWLWNSMRQSKAADGEDVGDLYSKSKKSRRLAKKRAAKLALLEAANPDVKVPLAEQTLDLPFATHDGTRGSPYTKSVSAVGPLAKVSKGLSTVTIGEGVGVSVSIEEAAEARKEVKKEMRGRSRKGIKSRNFLQTM